MVKNARENNECIMNENGNAEQYVVVKGEVLVICIEDDNGKNALTGLRLSKLFYFIEKDCVTLMCESRNFPMK